MEQESSQGIVRVHQIDGLLEVRLSDPRRLNAMSKELKQGLADALVLARDRDVRALLITGEGRAFSAGGDISALHEMKTAPAAHRRMLDAYQALTTPLLTLEKPSVAAINGLAAGAGVALALACDVRIAARSARLVFAFSKVGLVPDFALSFMLPRLIGAGRAKDLAFLRGHISAEEAMSWGMISEVVEDDQCYPRALEVASSLANGPTVALALTKKLFDDSFNNELSKTLDLEAAFQSIASQTSDHINARDAFLAKQDVRFNGQ